MKNWAPIGIAMVLIACTETDISDAQNATGLPLGVEAVELDMSTGADARLAAQPTGTGLPVVVSTATEVCNDSASNLRYVARSFSVTNNTGRLLTNLQAHAYTQPGNASGTALKDVSNFGGVAQPDVHKALPRHGMRCDDAPLLRPDAQRADLQLYSTADLLARTALVPNLPTGVHLLGYGFLAQQRSADTDGDGDPRTVAPGETAQVTVAYKVPVGTDTHYSFKATFVLFADDTRNELVQTPEDQRAGTTAGLSVLPTGTARVSVVGGPACGLSGTNRFQTSVLIGKTGSTDITESELDAPAVFTTITSAESRGAGSLLEAVTNAAPGAALCFTQDIPAIGLTIDRDLTLMGGESAALNGLTSFRSLQITGGSVNLYGFRIYNGRSDTGGGIHNAGTLTLRGMRLVQNIASSNAQARGAGIFSSGPLHLFDTVVEDNTAMGDDGSSDASTRAVGSGGTALGGGIYLDNAPLRLVGSLVTRNRTAGGRGGAGINGVEEIQGTEPPGFAFCTVIPSDGGGGGDAAGGGVFKSGSSTVENAGLVLNNVSAAGEGGSGGDTPGVCSQYSANLGSFGSIGPEDIAP